MIFNKKVKCTVVDLFFRVICLFPIFTTLFSESSANKILFAIVVFFLFALFYFRSIKRHIVVLLLLLIGQYLYAICNTQFPMENINLLFYYPFFIVYSYYFSQNRAEAVDWLNNNERYLIAIIYLWTLLVGISIFMPSSYQQESGGYYFVSFCDDIFRLGPAAMFIQVLVVIMQTIHKRKKAIWFMAIPMYCYIASSSRTYLVVGCCLLVISWFIACNNRKLFWITVLPLGFLVLVLMSISAIGDKILYTLDENNYGDIWFRVTSSRNVIWRKCLDAWRDSNILNKLLGGGIEFSYHVSGHWAHNDFLEILCSFGLVGLVQYLLAVMSLFGKKRGSVYVPHVIRICVISLWLFNAFFNMHYTYFCATLCLPFLILTIDEFFRSSKK